MPGYLQYSILTLNIKDGLDYKTSNAGFSPVTCYFFTTGFSRAHINRRSRHSGDII